MPKRPPTGADPFEARYAILLARRVPLNAIEIGRAYVIHARHGSVGVALRDRDEDGRVGYSLHREKWGEHYLSTEWDWDERPFPAFFGKGKALGGTAIPLLAIEGKPPKGEKRLLAWLAEREAEYKSVTEAAWQVILPGAFPQAHAASGAPKAPAAPKPKKPRAPRAPKSSSASRVVDRHRGKG